MEETNDNSFSATQFVALYNYFVENADQISKLEDLKNIDVEISTTGEIVDNTGLNSSKYFLKVFAIVNIILLIVGIIAGLCYLKSQTGGAQ